MTLLSFRVVGFEKKGPSARVELWMAPDLDCYALSLHQEWKEPNGRIASVSQQVVLSVLVGEPAPELFEIPASYAEKRPSELKPEELAAIRRQYPGLAVAELTEQMKADLRNKDGRYELSRAYAPK